jgi:hypothetical protein
MEPFPANYKDLPPTEQDRILNDRLAAIEARLKGNLSVLSDNSDIDHQSLPPMVEQCGEKVEQIQGQLIGHLAGILESIASWRSSLKSDQHSTDEVAKATSESTPSQKGPFTRDQLAAKLGDLTMKVVADSRWPEQADDLGVSVVGMLLYGFALATGRMVMFLDVEDIDAAVIQCIAKTIGSAPQWTTGLVQEANTASFNKDHHPGHHELIGVGHSYFGVHDQSAIIDNIFANIESTRGAS